MTLELGGLNPAIISKHADARLAARRLLWAKLLNAGQVCVSQNHVVIEQEILPAFVDQLQIALQEYHPRGSVGNDDYSKIVNEKQWQRLKDLLDSSKGKILLGGKTDKATLFFEPTVIQVESADDVFLNNESFGPLIPILPVESLDEAIKTANAIHATPLALYAFGTKAETDRILSSTRSGGASVNDAFFHASIQTLPFGGVGDSTSPSFPPSSLSIPYLKVYGKTNALAPRWPRRLPRPRLLRNLHAPPLHYHDAFMDGDAVGLEVSALFAREIEVVEADDGFEAGF